IKPATSLCCLRRSVENRRCTTTSPPTATSIAKATINRPVVMRIIGSLLAGIALARWVSTLSSEEHNAIDAWLPRTSENPQKAKFAEFSFHDVREYAVRSLPSTVKEVLSVEPDPHGKPSWRVEGG